MGQKYWSTRSRSKTKPRIVLDGAGPQQQPSRTPHWRSVVLILGLLTPSSLMSLHHLDAVAEGVRTHHSGESQAY